MGKTADTIKVEGGGLLPWRALISTNYIQGFAESHTVTELQLNFEMTVTPTLRSLRKLAGEKAAALPWPRCIDSFGSFPK